ncbi:hypothetical protein Enr10x_19640 [Gimesia panareensis]|uniref:Uncharacterized protein n=1 Tax=Gimesia panareensis TaxID=2527978 RepID=A0A517Q4U4_9PLAN|nr:hypothetical protein [Gimesia panareensis]QDT26654.1 hypothetical protein Enr10x_19640 [Gimesia panareensis]
MQSESLAWPIDSICLNRDVNTYSDLARIVYRRTCRTDFSEPGFCLITLGSKIDSNELRKTMVSLKQELAAIHERTRGMTLQYLSLGRFDQQNSTKPHRDNGPVECFLMLGYEPTEVQSALAISDYSRCASDRGLTPTEFLAEYNPMFQSGSEILRPYTTQVPCFSNFDYQIVCINNSCAPCSEAQPAWQGVLHTATILTPNARQCRVINSTLITSVAPGTPNVISEEQENQFVETTLVRRRDYESRQQADDF